MGAEIVGGQICPILSVASLAPREESIVKVPGAPQAPKAAAIACQGPVCKFWIPVSDGAGRMGGECTFTLLPAALQQVANAILAQKIPSLPVPS